MKKSHSFKTIDILFALTLFSIFAVSVLMVLLSGGRIYRNVVDDMTAQYQERTSVSYIVTKLRGYDRRDSVRIEPFGDGDALFLSGEADGVLYDTVIYLHEGTVYELYTEQGLAIEPQWGFPIVDAGSVRFSKYDGDTVLIEYETEGGAAESYVNFHSKEAIR